MTAHGRGGRRRCRLDGPTALARTGALRSARCTDWPCPSCSVTGIGGCAGGSGFRPLAPTIDRVDPALAGLVAELPDGIVVTDPDILASYRQDRAADPTAGTPLAVVRPTPHRRGADGAALGDRAPRRRWCRAARAPGCPAARPPLDGGIVLSTEKMRDITVDPVTRTAVVQPGLLNAEVKKAVAEHGLWYPPDPSSYEICSIGGNIATNAGGLCCVKYGVTTDYVLGLQVVLADGTAVRLGGPRLKDVAGLSPDQAVRRQRGHARGGHRGDAAAAAAAAPGVHGGRDLRLGGGRRRCGGDDHRQDPAVDAGVHGLGGHQRRRGQAADGPGPRGRRDDGGRLRRPRRGRRRGRRVHGPGVHRSRCDRSAFRPSDPDEGEAFVAARRFAIPAVEAKGSLLLEDVGVPLPALADLVGGVAKIAAEPRPDHLGDRARRRRQHPSADRLRPRRRRR